MEIKMNWRELFAKPELLPKRQLHSFSLWQKAFSRLLEL